MSHEVETMAWTGQVPWHGLGAEVNDQLTTEEWLKAAGLDWRVDLRLIMAQVGNRTIPIDGKMALLRSTDNKVLTIASNRWKPLQNADMFKFMDNYVAAGGISLETAGSLRDGRVIWGLGKLDHSFEVGKGDKVEGYLLITSPHEVGNAITIRTTTVRVVCANTMALAHSASTIVYSQNHLTEFDPRSAQTAVEAAHESLVLAGVRARKLRRLKITDEDAVRSVIVPLFAPQVLSEKAVMRADHVPRRDAQEGRADYGICSQGTRRNPRQRLGVC